MRLVAKKTASKRRLTGYIIVTILVVLAAGGCLLFRQLQLYHQRKAFRRAEAYVAQVALELAKTSSQQHTKVSHQTCQYSHQKYARGSRSCIASENLIYHHQTIDQANMLLHNMVQSGNGKVHGYGPENKTQYDASSGSQMITQDQDSHVLDGCTRSFTYYNQSVASDNASVGDFIARVSCYGKALAEYYPVSG